MRSRLVLVLACVMVLFGCRTETPAPNGLTPFGGTWTVLSIDGVEVAERMRAPRVQFQVRGVLHLVTRCRETEWPMRWIRPTGLVIGAAGPRDAGGACDAVDAAIEAAMSRVLAGVERFEDGRPSDRLTLFGSGGTVVLAQAAANPTSCTDC